MTTINMCLEEGDLMSVLKGTTACLALRSLFFRLETQLPHRGHLFFTGRQPRNCRTTWNALAEFWAPVSYFQPGNHAHRLPAVPCNPLAPQVMEAYPQCSCWTPNAALNLLLSNISWHLWDTAGGKMPVHLLLSCMAEALPILAQKLVAKWFLLIGKGRFIKTKSLQDHKFWSSHIEIFSCLG